MYFKTEFGLEEPNLEIPSELTRQQAQTLMEMMNVSFHNIVEYADEEVFDPADFGLKEEDELGEF